MCINRVAGEYCYPGPAWLSCGFAPMGGMIRRLVLYACAVCIEIKTSSNWISSGLRWSSLLTCSTLQWPENKKKEGKQFV